MIAKYDCTNYDMLDFIVKNNLGNILVVHPNSMLMTVGYFKCKQKNPQAHGYRCSFHPGVFQSIDFP